MNKFINKILKETEENDDPFFQPKDIEKRLEERQKEIVVKIKLGLQNIKISYKNEDWNSQQEKLFLEIFSKLHVNEKYSKRWNGYFLKDENNKKRCFFNLKYDTFWISYEYIWRVFTKRFHWIYDETEHFMKNMLKIHFRLYEFIPRESRFI